MYTIYVSYESFAAAVQAASGTTIHGEALVTTATSGGLPTRETLALYLTAPLPTTIAAIRLPVETLAPFGHPDVVLAQWRDGRWQRLQALTTHLARYLQQTLGATLHPGLCLVPGLADDLARWAGDQQLWRVAQADPGDPRTRQLVWLAETTTEVR